MEKKHFSLRLDGELLLKLHTMAEESGRSVNQEIVQLIRRGIDAFELEHGVIWTDFAQK